MIAGRKSVIAGMVFVLFLLFLLKVYHTLTPNLDSSATNRFSGSPTTLK